MNDSSSLCTECGLCCNGVIFADVQLQPGDDAGKLKRLGLAVSGRTGRGRFRQPCAALEGCLCRIYPDRPKYCREFECVLLKQVRAGRLKQSIALQTIRTAQERAGKVRSLLVSLGDTDEQTALSLRFQRISRRLQNPPTDTAARMLFGELTVAVHDLNLLLSQSFYPGPR